MFRITANMAQRIAATVVQRCEVDSERVNP
jgi:hypothetical protein